MSGESSASSGDEVVRALLRLAGTMGKPAVSVNLAEEALRGDVDLSGLLRFFFDRALCGLTCGLACFSALSLSPSSATPEIPSPR